MRLKPYEVAALAKEKENSKEQVGDGADIVGEQLAEEEEMRCLETGQAEEEVLNDETKNEEQEESEDSDEGAMPVPQIRIGPDGEIILDDKSLVIYTCIVLCAFRYKRFSFAVHRHNGGEEEQTNAGKLGCCY